MDKQIFYNVKEASAFLGFKPSYVYKLVMWRKLPFYKVGRSVRFKHEDLVNFLSECRISSIAEMEHNKKVG